MFYKVLDMPGGDRRISEPSTTYVSLFWAAVVFDKSKFSWFQGEKN